MMSIHVFPLGIGTNSATFQGKKEALNAGIVQRGLFGSCLIMS